MKPNKWKSIYDKIKTIDFEICETMSSIEMLDIDFLAGFSVELLDSMYSVAFFT